MTAEIPGAMDEIPALRAIRQVASHPVERAMSLPPSCYFDPALAEWERSAIFEREWLCVGHVSELPKRGSYLTAALLGNPVAVWRGEADTVRAFHNVCLHRNCRLLTGKGAASVLVCPYHAWSYDLDGKLRAAPLMPTEILPQGGRLTELRCEIWQGFIYVNLAPDGTALAPRLAGLSSELGAYALPEMRTLLSFQETWAANWKCLIENFIESYHLFRVHAKTLEPTSPTSGVRVWPGGEGYCFHTLNTSPPPDPTSFDESVPDSIKNREVLACIFPGHLLSVTPRTALWLSVIPVREDQLSLSCSFAVAPGHLAASGEEASAFAARAQEQITAFTAEDRSVVEKVFDGLRSVAARSGPLAPLERPLWEFQRYLAARSLTIRPTAAAAGLPTG